MAGVVMQIFESILSKLGELIFAFAHNKVSSTNELGLTLKTLQTALKALSARASDVEEQIRNAEQSGRKKRKREVDEWLVDVNSIRTEVAELVAQAEPAGYIRRMFGQGDATRLTEQVKNLIEQSRHFGELLLDIGGSSMVRAEALKMKEEERLEEVVKVCSIKRKGDGMRLRMPNTLKRLFIKCAFEPSKKRRNAFEDGLCLFRNPDTVSILTNLTALVLKGCYWLKHLPYLGELKALKELDLSDTGIKDVPREVEKLLDLKTSYVPPLPSGLRYLCFSADTLQILGSI